MPVYSYEDEETGTRVDMRRPVEDRDKPIVLRRRKTVPDRVGVIVAGANTEDGDFNKRIQKGYRQLEEKQGSRFRSGFSKKQIKKTWFK